MAVLGDDEDRFAVGERVRGERGQAVKGKRVRVCFDRKVEDRTSGRRPGHDGAVVFNPKAARSGSGTEGRAACRTVQRRASGAHVLRTPRTTEGVRGPNVR